MDRLGPIINRLEPIVELLKPLMTPVYRHLEYHIKLKEKVEELRSVLEDLNKLLEDINLKKQNAEARPRKVVRKEVMRWLEKVQTINNEIQALEQNFQNVSYLRRGSLGKRVHKKIEEVKELILQQGSFPDDIAIDQPPGRGMTLPTEDARGRTDVKQQIWGYLIGDAVGMIGVCGPGGIGKTTLMKNIHNDLLNESKFDKVVWATVQYPVSIVKLQDNIARNMQQTLLENETEEQRAATLSEILSRVRYVLILDDAWGKFSFEDIGIPKPTQQNGCKVVVTSRSIELCYNIGCEQVVRMQQLSKEESLNLFKDTVEWDGLSKIRNLEEILKLMVAECAGLPLAIVVIARSMRGENDISAWEYALFELSSRVRRVRGWDDEIFERLKFSYDRLNDAELQNCFLHCSLYPKDGSIWRHGLIESWIDNGLIEQLETGKLMRDRANVILDSLINKCLIEKVQLDSCFVRMHDVMRAMALHVAGPRFMAKAGLRLTKVPEGNKWKEDLQKVWLCSNKITDISFNLSPNCPNLSSLDLSNNRNLRLIPDSFFVHLLGLRCLNLSSTTLEALPYSVSNLENLTALRLCYCDNLSYVPSLAKLKALKTLDLKYAGIQEAPRGMEMLVNLQYLDLHCPKLVELPMGIFYNLTYLQFLAVALKSTGNAMIAEKVIRLKIVENFVGCFVDPQGLNDFVKFFHQDQRFTRYWIWVGKHSFSSFALDFIMGSEDWGMREVFYDIMPSKDWRMIEDFNAFEFRDMQIAKTIILMEVEIGIDDSVLLLNDFRLLKIRDCSGVKSLSKTALFKKATDLRFCEINDCDELECILDLSASSSVCSPSDKLEILELCQLPNLQLLVKREVQAASASSTSLARISSSIFSNLKIFKIKNCRRIKKLFPSELLNGLQNLEEIDVESCRKLEVLIEVEEEKETLTTVGNSDIMAFTLPKLRKLRLVDLPKLKSICTARGVIGSTSLQTLEICLCPMLNRIPLNLSLLPNSELSSYSLLQEIKIESKEWWESLVWDSPSTKDILRPFLKSESEVTSLYRVFCDLQQFNNYVKSFQGQNVDWYDLRVEATSDDDGDGDGDGDGDIHVDYDDFEGVITLNGLEVSGDHHVLLPNDVQLLKIRMCNGVKSLDKTFLLKTAAYLRSCLIKQCEGLECIIQIKQRQIRKGFRRFSPFNRLSTLALVQLPNLHALVEVEVQTASTPSTSRAPTPPSIFPLLKVLKIHECPRIKKLFPSKLLKSLQKLQLIHVVDCAEMEEMIEVEEGKDTLMTEGKNETITFTFSKLKELRLIGLSNLKSICTAGGIMVCDSLKIIEIAECPKLKRIPLYLPMLPNGELSRPPSLQEIYIESREWWESLEWDNPSAKDILLPLLDLNYSDYQSLYSIVDPSFFESEDDSYETEDEDDSYEPEDE